MKLTALGNLCRLIDGAAVLSLDIFDTALVRRVGQPIDVFTIVAAEYRRRRRDAAPWDFVNARILAEHQARTVRARLSGHYEVDLDAIYAQLETPRGWDGATLRALELELERALIAPNEYIRALYRYALQRGKRVLFLSDMYLPEPFIAELLAQSGYDGPHQLYVSSATTHGHSKASGSIFPWLADELRVPRDQVLHIGDNLTSDVVMPLRHGFNAFFYERCGLRADRLRPLPWFDDPAARVHRGLGHHLHVDPARARLGFWSGFGFQILGLLPFAYPGDEGRLDAATALGNHPVAQAVLRLLDPSRAATDKRARETLEGARAFAAAFGPLQARFETLAVSRELALAPLRRVLAQPTASEAARLGDLPREPLRTTLLPSPRLPLSWLEARRVLEEYRTSLWPAGHRARVRGLVRLRRDAGA